MTRTRLGVGIADDVIRANIRQVADTTSPTEWEHGGGWYADAAGQCEAMASDSDVGFETAAAVVAALSPQTMWSVNLRAARQILADGTQLDGTLGANHARALAVLDGRVTPDDWHAKIGRFFRNICGDWVPVTVDTWTFRIAMGDPDADAKILQRVGAYDTLELAYQAVAGDLHVPPAVLQAATWTAYRHHAYATRLDERLGR